MNNMWPELQEDRKRILNIIQKQGPISKQSIQLMTNIKLTTLNRVLSDLLEVQLIVEEALGESTGGRRPTLYNVNSSRFYIVGIDISRTYTQIVIANLKMQILKERRFAMEAGFSTEETLNHIAKDIIKLLNELKIDKEEILGIGAGMVGPLDREKGLLLNPAASMGCSWKNISVTEGLRDRLSMPVVIDNGANTAVLGEYFYGSGKGYYNIVYINCGVGIRTGVITDGRIIRAINDREDAFGHMVIDIDGKPCYCGSYGCVESYASIPSILNDFKGEIKKGKTSLISKNLEEIDYLDVFKAAEEGDSASREAVVNSAHVFGAALANYIKLLNPQLLVLSGPTVYNSDIFYKTSTETALKRINEANLNIKFSKGGYFKKYAIAIGAAAMVVEAYLE